MAQTYTELRRDLDRDLQRQGFNRTQREALTRVLATTLSTNLPSWFATPQLEQLSAPATKALTGDLTLSGADQIARRLVVTPDASGRTLTTRTATQIQAAMADVKGSAVVVGDEFEQWVINGDPSFDMTLVAGSGVTLVGGADLRSGGKLCYRVTAIGGAPTVSCYSTLPDDQSDDWDAVTDGLTTDLATLDSETAQSVGKLTLAPITIGPAPLDIDGTGNQALVGFVLLMGLLTTTTTGARNWTLPTPEALLTALDIVALAPLVVVGSQFDIHVINLGAGGTSATFVTPGGNVTLVGNMAVAGETSGRFRIRYSNSTRGPTAAYTIYRLT